MSKKTGTKMPRSIYEQILALVKPLGWMVDVRDGRDRYKKLVTLRRNGKVVCIDQDVGFSGQGDLKYLKVAVHPEHFDPELESLAGVSELINRNLKQNWFHHSGYQSFPHVGDEKEPAAMAYRVSGTKALQNLLHVF